jgi:CCR4-NOT transcription complex subunit 1
VLIERLIVSKPHPWGLLVTFIELFRNPRFNFLGHEFVTAAPEIENLFQCVARTCYGGPPPAQRPPEDALDAK